MGFKYQIELMYELADIFVPQLSWAYFWGQNGGWSEATGGHWRSIASILCPKSNLTVWEYGNSFRYQILRSLKSEAALRSLRFFVAGSLHAIIVISIILR